MTTPTHVAIFECELCGEEYEDHLLAMAPHVCEDCCSGNPEDSQDLEDQLERLMASTSPTATNQGSK